MDRISLCNQGFYAYHGCEAHERGYGQRFFVDVDIFGDWSAAGRSDDLNEALDYTRVYSIVKQIVEGERYNLLEALAENVATKILDFPQAEAVSIRIRKPGTPLAGVLDHVEVAIERQRRI